MAENFDVNLLKERTEYEYFLCSATRREHYCYAVVGYNSLIDLIKDYIIVCMFAEIFETFASDHDDYYFDDIVNNMVSENSHKDIIDGKKAFFALTEFDYDSLDLYLPIELWAEYENLIPGKQIIIIEKYKNIKFIEDLHDKFIRSIRESKVYKHYVVVNGEYTFDDISLFWKR